MTKVRRSLLAVAVPLVIVLIGASCRQWQPASGGNAGEELYRKNCVTCHGINGAGADGPSIAARRHSPDEIAARVVSGGGGMPGFSERLTPSEISAVAEYSASLSAAAPPVAAVTETRTATASPAP